MKRNATHPRLDWIDGVKGLGMLLMYYGHVLQSMPQDSSAVLQLRFIYSFHMPLFFVLSGFFFRPAARLWPRAGQLALRRLLPVAFFGASMFPLWCAVSVHHHRHWWQDATLRAGDYLHGAPALDWVTWFLVCLFVCELMALVVLPRLGGVATRVAFGFGCIVLGALGCGHPGALHGWVGEVGGNWFLAEGVVGLGFYAIGHATWPWIRALAGRPWLTALLGGLGALAVLATFRLNHPADDLQAVMMASEQHGLVVDFAFTALAGSMAVIALGLLMPAPRWLLWIGRNTLALLGLAGLFFHFVNPWLTTLLAPADTPLAVTVYAFGVAAISLALCVPAVFALNRWAPWAVGKDATPAPRAGTPVAALDFGPDAHAD